MRRLTLTLLAVVAAACANVGTLDDGEEPAGAGGEFTGAGGGGGGAGGSGGGGVPGAADMAVASILDEGPGAPPDTGLPPDPTRPPRACAEREDCDTPFDDNCDGRVNEGCPCRAAEIPCYRGDPRDLTSPSASCRMGTQACELETYGPCTGDVLPRAEQCNGLDDDCDGRVDEDDECQNAPPRALCPPDQVGGPLTRYALEGGYQDPDGDPMVRATWRLREGPPGTTSRPDPDNALRSAVFADLQGVYLLELEVEDARGGIGRCTTTIRATESRDALRVELVWNVGARADTADVDLHLKRTPAAIWHASGPTGDDCHWRNCSVCNNANIYDEDDCRAHLGELNRTPRGPPPQVQWSAPLDEDDPRLDLDDVDGYGPENVNIRAPREGSTWRVGVHLWDDHGAGNSTVTVRIYCAGEVAREYAPQVLRATDTSGGANTEFWEVADVEWRGGRCTVSDLAAAACPRICSNREATAGGCPAGRSRGAACP